MSTTHKLLTLLIATLMGFAILIFYLFKTQQEMQSKLNTLYFGSYIPVTTLKDISLELNKEIILKVHHARDTQRKTGFLVKELHISNEKMAKAWHAYALSYKNNKEKKFVMHTDLQMQKFYNYIEALITHLKTQKSTSLVSLVPLVETAHHIDSLLGQLITYEDKIAQENRKRVYSSYEPEILTLTTLTFFIILLVIALYYLISQSIKRNEKKLKALAVELSHVNNELHHASITDGLTKLYNRRYFDQIFANELKRAHRERVPLSFMMLDIDHFKKYNDHYGHPAGDEVIRRVAGHLKNHFKRPSDLIFRLGGEEFGILVQGSGFEHLLSIAQRVVEEMRTLNLEHVMSQTEQFVTVSLGLVHFNIANEMSAESLYEHTDAQLYKAKEHGRNRVEYDLL